MTLVKMSNLNRFAALYSDDEDDSPKTQPKKVAAPAPAPAPKKKNKARGRGGRGGNRGGDRGGNRGGRGGNRGRRNYDRKEDRRDQRRRDDRDRRNFRDGDHRRTRQPRNGVRDHRQGRDAKKGGHGGIGTNAQDVEAGIAEVRGEDVQNENGEQVPVVEEEPEDTGLTVEEYKAKVLAEKRAALAKLTGQKEARKVEASEGERVTREREGVIKTYGASKKKAGGESKKKKKGFVSADRFFATKAREDRSNDRGRGRGYGDRDRNDRSRGRGRDGDDRRNDRSRGSKPRAININDTNAFPTLG